MHIFNRKPFLLGILNIWLRNWPHLRKKIWGSRFCYFNSVNIRNKQTNRNGKTALSIHHVRLHRMLAEAQDVGQSIPIQCNPLIHVVSKTNVFDVKCSHFDCSSWGECFFFCCFTWDKSVSWIWQGKSSPLFLPSRQPYSRTGAVLLAQCTVPPFLITELLW